MLNHYFEVRVDDNLRPVGFFGRILHRIHGYSVSTGTSGIAIDFPEWSAAQGKMSANTGNVLRVLGDKDKLSGLLSNTGLMQFLIEGGVSLTGIRSVPEEAHYICLRRNNKISKYARLLKNPSSILGHDQDTSSATDEDIHVAKRFQVSEGVAMAANNLMAKKIKEEKSSGLLKVPSVSNGRSFDLYLTRTGAQVATGCDFSTYGLSLNNSAVPSW